MNRRPSIRLLNVFFRSCTAVGVLVYLHAPTATAQDKATARPPALVAPESGVQWRDLKPAQRASLMPLERQWGGIGQNQKQKWLEIANRFPSMPADEQARIQARMADWAKLTPQERGQTRILFQEAKQVAPQDRKAQWDAYQALPQEQRRQLAARASPAASAGSADTTRKAGQVPAIRPERGDKPAMALQTKSNIIPNPTLAAAPKPVAPTVVQAQPGATTTLISKRPAPPAHQQTGLPKIAATPGFVDKSTLLPQRGPQGAATRSAAASEAQSTLRR